ncbi:MAG: CBS domain-containing protein [Anaerolineales bacterium]|jgi:CBS domain-containing protein
MRTIEHVLRTKGDTIFSTSPEATVFDALHMMAEYNVGALLVYSGEQLVGIVSERDYARKIVLKGRTSRETTVSEIMSSPLITANVSMTVRECLERMTSHHVRHMPVLRENEIVGIVSMGDLVSAIISEQEILIQKLEKHIRERSKIF